MGCGTRPGLQNGTGGRGIGGLTGTGGAAGMPSSCAGPSDERLVVAPQRILRLTMTETLNTIRYLIDDTEARALVTDGIITWVQRHRRLATRISSPAGVAHHRRHLRRARRDRGPRRQIRARQLRAGHRVSDRHRCVRDRLPRQAGGAGVPAAAHPRRTFTIHGALHQAAQHADGQRLRGHLHRRGSDQLRGQCAADVAPDALALGARGSRDGLDVPGRHSADRPRAGDPPVVLPDRSASRRRAAGGGERGDAARQPGGARGDAAGVAARPGLVAHDHRDVLPAQPAAVRPG